MKLIACLGVMTLLPAALLAQWGEFKSKSAPRTPDGRVNLAAPAPRAADGKPDLSGVWDKGLLPSEVPPPGPFAGIAPSLAFRDLKNALGAEVPMLPWAAKLKAERHAANHETPVFLAHGRQDPVVPLDRALQSRDALIALGHPVEWHEYTMAHSVCMEEIADLNRFLLRVLAS